MMARRVTVRTTASSAMPPSQSVAQPAMEKERLRMCKASEPAVRVY